MDPQHRLFLQASWAALEHAGIIPKSGEKNRTAVFASSGTAGYLRHHVLPSLDRQGLAKHFAVDLGNRMDT